MVLITWITFASVTTCFGCLGSNMYSSPPFLPARQPAGFKLLSAAMFLPEQYQSAPFQGLLPALWPR